MRDLSKTIKRTESGELRIQMVAHTRVNGRMIGWTAMESSFIQTARPRMKDTGSRTSSTAQVEYIMKSTNMPTIRGASIILIFRISRINGNTMKANLTVTSDTERE
jgi:hypothetical protein